MGGVGEDAIDTHQHSQKKFFIIQHQTTLST